MNPSYCLVRRDVSYDVSDCIPETLPGNHGHIINTALKDRL